jgi:hypothetical protein
LQELGERLNAQKDSGARKVLETVSKLNQQREAQWDGEQADEDV